ncbi:MAG: EAL domain-containing protein [Oceanospirillaceae bacterium]
MFQNTIKTGRFLSTAVFGVLLLFFLSLNYVFLVNQWTNKASIFDEKLQQSSKFINNDVIKYLAPLNYKFKHKECSKAILEGMRLAEYHSVKLHEYGFLDGQNLLCSTSRGIFEKPITQPLSDISSEGNPLEFTTFKPVDNFPGNIKAMRLKFGNFQALIKPDTIIQLQPSWMKISIFVYNKNHFIKIIGDTSIQALTKKPTPSFTQFRGLIWQYQSCYAESTCATYEVNIIEYIINNKSLILIVFATLLLLLFLSIFRIHYFIRYFYSFNRQVYRGLNDDQVLCYYQPIIDNQTGTISSCEVLCRWKDKEGVIHGAFPFLSHVIKNKQTAKFTQILVAKAIKEFKHAGLLTNAKLSINSFPEDIASGHIERVLEQQLSFEEHAYIVVEITEQQEGNHTAVNKAIRKLHEKGVKIAIDDFGTGYSNLEQLKDLEVDYLKVDQGFVLCMLENQLHLNLVEHIIKLAKEMKLAIVAEGVETQLIQDKIISLDIDFSQGYHYAKPMPIESLVDYFKAMNS